MNNDDNERTMHRSYLFFISSKLNVPTTRDKTDARPYPKHIKLEKQFVSRKGETAGMFW